MKLLCHIQVKTISEISFTGPLNDLFRKSGYLVFEADNHSDGYLMEQGKALIDQVEEVCIHFECAEDASIGQIKMLLETLRKSSKRSFYQLDGKHEQLEKMMKFIKAEKVVTLADQLSSNPSASK